MSGHVRRRGKGSWELKFDLGTDPITGKRLTRYHSFKGTKREAEAELTRLKAGADRGKYVDPSKLTWPGSSIAGNLGLRPRFPPRRSNAIES
jgi:integrase